MNDIQIMGILGGIAFQHPSVMSMVSQLQSAWTKHQTEAMTAYSEYLAAVAKTDGGPMSMAGALLDTMKAHPNLAPFVVLVLGIVYPHIPETQQTITQVQTQL